MIGVLPVCLPESAHGYAAPRGARATPLAAVTLRGNSERTPEERGRFGLE
jgi:hypothetical protein